MSDSNRIAVRAVREVTRGTTPATPAFRDLRYTSFSPATGIQTVESAEIRADRRQSDVSLVGVAPAPTLSGELSAGTYDDLIEAAMMAAWVKTPEKDNSRVTGNITAVSTTAYTTTAAGGTPLPGNLIRATGFGDAANNRVFKAGASTTSTSIVMTGGVAEASPPSTARLKVIGWEGASGDLAAVTSGGNAITTAAADFEDMGIVPGMWIYVGGTATANRFATTGVSGWVRVSAVEDDTLWFDIVPAGWAADAGTGKTIRLYWGDVVREGTTEISQTVEAEQADVTKFHYFRGALVNTFALTVPQAAIATVQFGFEAMEYDPETARLSGATTVAPSTSPVLNGAANVGRIAENGAAITGTANLVTQFSLNVNNNVRRKGALGVIGAADMGLGESGTTGQFTSYFGDIAVLGRILSNTASSINVPLLDIDGNGYMLDVPQLKYTGGDPDFGSKNGDTTIAPTFRALVHPTLGYQLQIQRMEGVGA